MAEGVNRLAKMAGVESIARNLEMEDEEAKKDIQLHQKDLWGDLYAGGESGSGGGGNGGSGSAGATGGSSGASVTGNIVDGDGDVDPAAEILDSDMRIMSARDVNLNIVPRHDESQPQPQQPPVVNVPAPVVNMPAAAKPPLWQQLATGLGLAAGGLGIGYGLSHMPTPQIPQPPAAQHDHNLHDIGLLPED